MSAPADARLVILGGGPAGLAAAFYAARAGLAPLVLERAAAPGGLCRTFTWGAHRYDAGAHRFHDRDPEVTADVRALLGTELHEVDAPSQVLHDGRLLAFPPQPREWLAAAGLRAGAVMASEVMRGRWWPRPERSFEDYALNRYGARLGRPLLLDYSEKLWGLAASELSPAVATRRLPGLGVGALLRATLGGGRSIRHLDGRFLYPRTGYGAIADALAAALPAGTLCTGRDVVGLACTRGRIRRVELADGDAIPVPDRLVSTLPLTVLVRLLGDVLPTSVHRAAARLRFRHVRLIAVRLAATRCSPNASIYLPDPRLAVARVSEPKNRSAAMAPPDETLLCAEVPCSPADPLATLDDAALAARVIAELAGAGLLAPAAVRGWRHHLLPHAYPVGARDAADAAATVHDGVAAIANLDLLGRGGRFWYSHLHDQLRAAKELLGSRARATAPRPQLVGAHAEVGAQTVPAAPPA
jgi:protoporphyrinogen oxidase